MKKNKILGLFLFMLLVLLFPKHASADVVFSVQKSADNLKPNQEVTVTIKATVPQNSQLESYSLYFKPIDTSGNNPLTYLSGTAASGVSLGQSGANITINYSGAAINSDLNPIATLKYKVNSGAKAGNVTLKLDKAQNCKAAASCSTNNMNLTIASLSSDATLKSLKIPNATLSPEFNSNTTEYKTTVKDLKEVTVNAEATDSSSKIQISENYKNLQKGDNLIKIVVTSENGSSKTYTINVTLTLTPTEEELLKANALLKSLKIKGFKLEFDKNEKKYFLEVPNSKKKLSIQAEAENSKSEIKIDNPKLKIGKNTIKITVTSEDKSKTETYQIIVTRKEAKKKVVKTCPDTTSSREWIIFSILLFVGFSLGIVLGYLLCKKDVLKKIFKKRDKKQKEKKEKKEKENLSNTIELDTTKILEESNKK